MHTSQRKCTPAVRGGKVQKKNDWSLTPNYYSHAQRDVLIDRKRPGQGYHHFLKPRDVRTFINILPNWEELLGGLNGIVLAPGEDGIAGYHTFGVVHICAWEEEMWHDYKHDDIFFRNHEPIFKRLGVPIEYSEDGGVLCQFNDSTVRAYQLLHILLHELGHHHDRITTKAHRRTGRGEPYAEAYALRYETQIWERYLETFELY